MVGTYNLSNDPPPPGEGGGMGRLGIDRAIIVLSN